MKAWVLYETNTLPVLGELQDPELKDGFAIVRLTASALNHRDVWIAKGRYAGIKLPCVPGSDGCGWYNGRRVIINPGWNWGSNEFVQSKDFRILGMPDNGTFSEFTSIPEIYLHDVPDHLTDVEAAALPLAGVTAYRALITKCKAEKGMKVLVTGAGGGVALFAIQLALALGCEVYASSGSPDKLQRVTQMGVAGTVNYKDENPETAGWVENLKSMAGGFDIIIDSAAGDGFRHLISLANPGGKIVFYGGTLGTINGLNPQNIFWKQISIMGSTMGSENDFSEMLNFVNVHQIKPVVDTVYYFDEWDKSYTKMVEGGQFGKLVCLHNI